MVKLNTNLNDNGIRTAAEVKRVLHDIAYALRLTQGIKMQMIAAKRKSIVPAKVIGGRLLPSCAA